MTEWGLIGGPRNEEVGNGPVPDGYEHEGPGSNLGPTYAPELRGAGSIYRWATDAAYIRDGEAFLAHPPTHLADVSIVAFRQSLYALKDAPDTLEAQDARDSIDRFRSAGWI